ncbi:hypothetical protein [Mycobacterium lepromatosis]|uniref:hypothetical protein n=1 Tax=Mycobacterium lepromatosis TaxID=480418 RepID=UPI000678D017|nr:hypothetical protein [Mycobacterium lepromatosis]
MIAILAIGAHTADKLFELRQTYRIAALEELHTCRRVLLGISARTNGRDGEAGERRRHGR